MYGAAPDRGSVMVKEKSKRREHEREPWEHEKGVQGPGMIHLD